MKDRLEFDNLKTIDKVIRKACICYQQIKHKGDGGKKWTEKKGSNFSQGIKGNKYTNAKGPYKNKKNGNSNKTQQRSRFPNDFKPNEKTKKNEVEPTSRPLV